MSPLALARATVLVSYFGLLALLLAWYSVLAPSPYFPVALVLMVAVIPLLLPLRGLLHGRPYTHAWTGFLTLIYFSHGVMIAAAEPGERVYGLLEVGLSLALFAGSIAYVRCHSAAQRPSV